MDLTKQEFEAVGQTVAEVHQDVVNELNELHLATVGGGIGEVTLC